MSTNNTYHTYDTTTAEGAAKLLADAQRAARVITRGRAEFSEDLVAETAVAALESPRRGTMHYGIVRAVAKQQHYAAEAAIKQIHPYELRAYIEFQKRQVQMVQEIHRDLTTSDLNDLADDIVAEYSTPKKPIRRAVIMLAHRLNIPLSASRLEATQLLQNDTSVNPSPRDDADAFADAICSLVERENVPRKKLLLGYAYFAARIGCPLPVPASLSKHCTIQIGGAVAAAGGAYKIANVFLKTGGVQEIFASFFAPFGEITADQRGAVAALISELGPARGETIWQACLAEARRDNRRKRTKDEMDS